MNVRTLFKIPFLLLAVCAAFLLAAAPAHADGIIIPNPPPDRPISWRDVPLTVKYHQVDVTIANQIATTHVDQVFVNDAHYAVEGTYLFPLTEDAVINSFEMTVDGKKLTGRLLGKDEARAIYERIVREQRDPALLEYVGRGAFQASIFPIPPGGERRIELTYTQVLDKTVGLVHYRYPLNTEKFSARPLERVAVTVRIEDRVPVRAVYSPGFDIAVQREGENAATASYEASDVLPDRDFDLYYSVSTDAIDINFLSYKPSDEDGYFLLLVTPPLESVATDVVAKDVIMVLDTSGSMEGEKLIQAKLAAAYILDQLRERDRFGVVSFNSAVQKLSGKLLPAAERRRGHAFITGLVARGSTDINRAVLEAAASADPQRTTILILLTDGQPTVGEIDPERILANAQRALPDSVRLFPFGLGYDVDTYLLDKLSSGQRGVSGYVRSDERIDEAVSEFFARVEAPVLTDVSLDFVGIDVEDLYPYPMPDLFAGTQLAVLGRYHAGGTAALAVDGRIGDRAPTYRYPGLMFAKEGGPDFIARLWAQRKVGYLLSQIRLNGADEELVAEVIELSTRYGIVTPYTSFLVDEPELALSSEGRRELTRNFDARGAGGASAAPTGAAAVGRAMAEKQLASADQANVSSAQQVKHIGDATFIRRDEVWTDTRFDASVMHAEAVAFGSRRYFDLLRQYPEIGRYLALGDRVIVVLGDKAFRITSS